MSGRAVGVHLTVRRVPEAMAFVEAAERLGVHAAWMTAGGAGADSLTALAVIGARTERILLGTSIAVTFSRHPLAMAQQVVAITDVAEDRFRLGIGTSHRPTIEGAYGLAFERPIEHLREYVLVLQQAFHGGEIDFEGKRFRVHARLAVSPRVPIFVSALRERSYRLAGEVADGAISWVTPSSFLRDVAGPALRDEAARRGRPRPRLIGHALALVCDDVSAARDAGRERLASYTRMTFYQEMFAVAGYPEARDGVVSDALVDDLVLVGGEAQVADGVRRFLEAGVDELILTLLTPAGAGDAERLRTFRLLGSLGGA